ncbi:nucleotidyltransferase family protein [Falsirhodobacter xinxiangensis]|uniref:nucleotidyltransferase family protein n=1 Tax=Falsirhodobacter xinxiangensis TaxID=2530049 RepID=UPI0010AAB9C0|nr:GSU2403 family nucleotidyltransferase fold protein [Rhodobacter xinxiangensis]
MPAAIPQPFQVLYSELAQRTLDADFATEFDLAGRFISNEIKGRRYWYFDRSDYDGKKKRTYVGPMDDPDITARVERFNEMKNDVRERRKLVSTLTNQGGLPKPDRITGDVIAALANAGFFRMRGVLVGTAAFQTYPALLGIRLPETAMQTGDADFAQFHSISVAVEDEMPPILDVLQNVDPSFRPVPHVSGKPVPTQFVSASRFKVEFLTPNRGSGEHDATPAPMPALGGAGAQPLRFLDFLIHTPRRAVLLHRGGYSIRVPSPERFAVHKLIVSQRRRSDDDGTAKSRKDLRQAQLIMEAMVATRAQDDLAEVFVEALDRGPAWSKEIRAAFRRLPAESAATIRTGLMDGMKALDIPHRRHLQVIDP